MRPAKWTESAIKQAFDSFINEYGRLPAKHEMYGKYNGSFPRPQSVKRSLGVTLGEYLAEKYAAFLNSYNSRIYNNMTAEYWIGNFKSQYIKLKGPAEKNYNKFRDKGTPCSKTLERIAGVSSWSELLSLCAFPDGKKIELTGEVIFDETPENYQKLRIKLQSLLNTHNKP